MDPVSYFAVPVVLMLVALLVPAIIKLGVPKPAAHMFAFYFAILSAITPPVAMHSSSASIVGKRNRMTNTQRRGGWLCSF